MLSSASHWYLPVCPSNGTQKVPMILVLAYLQPLMQQKFGNDETALQPYIIWTQGSGFVRGCV